MQTPEFVAVVARPGETLASLAAVWLRDPSRAWEIADVQRHRRGRPRPGTRRSPCAPSAGAGSTPERYQTVPVLTYHQFAEKSTNRMTVSREAFEAQMQLLKDKGYRVIPLEQLVDFLDFRGQIPEKSVVITIDDGWRATYDIAFPILRKYGYPATLFVYTQLITGGAKTLSWDQVREMSDQGLDVQCHTVSHRNLSLAQDQESADQYFDDDRAGNRRVDAHDRAEAGQASDDHGLPLRRHQRARDHAAEAAGLPGGPDGRRARPTRSSRRPSGSGAR